MKSKKGVVSVILSLGGLIVITILAFVLLGGLALLTKLLAQNFLRLAGIILLIFAGLSFTGVAKFNIKQRTRMIMLIAGIVLVILPAIGIASGLTLSAVIP